MEVLEAADAAATADDVGSVSSFTRQWREAALHFFDCLLLFLESPVNESITSVEEPSLITNLLAIIDATTAVDSTHTHTKRIKQHAEKVN